MLHLIDNSTGKIKEAVLGNPIKTAVGAGVALLGTGLLVVASRRKKKRVVSRKTKRKRSVTRRRKVTKVRGRIRKSRTRKVHRHKGKHRGTKKIHYTKKGQPYIILANGRARFIKHSSARTRKRRKGGSY